MLEAGSSPDFSSGAAGVPGGGGGDGCANQARGFSARLELPLFCRWVGWGGVGWGGE